MGGQKDDSDRPTQKQAKESKKRRKNPGKIDLAKSDQKLMLSKILKKSPYGFTKAGYKLDQDFETNQGLSKHG